MKFEKRHRKIDLIMHSIKVAFIFFIVFYLYSCDTTGSSKVDSFKDSLILKWRLDSNTCIGYRSFQIGDSIIKKYKLIGTSIDNVKLVMGKPNYQSKGVDNQWILRYCISGCCPNIEGDPCILDMIFINGKFDSFGYTCV